MPTRRETALLLAGAPLAGLGFGSGSVFATEAPGAGGKPLRLAARSKLVMVGDSITDTDRARPVGEGRGEALGKGYVAMIDALLGAVYPELAIRVVNQGISGNTVRNLKDRWQTDVLDLKPDWVSVMIGTNDVWRQFDSPRQPERHVQIDEYEKTFDELIRTTKPLVQGIVLMTPFFLEPNRQDGMRAQMDRYGAVVRKLAGAHDTVFVDTQSAFEPVLAAYYSATLAWDRVHPNHIGHLVLARAFVNALGFSWTR